ncbi:MAG: hypothetical protein AAF653_13765, partial [Chloroflexota bacterium]
MTRQRLPGLETVIFVLLGAVGMLAPHTFRQVLWQLPAPVARLYVDFRGIVWFLMDFPLVAVLILTTVYLAISGRFRRERWRVARDAMMRGGAIFWVALLLWMALTALWAP